MMRIPLVHKSLTGIGNNRSSATLITSKIMGYTVLRIRDVLSRIRIFHPVSQIQGQKGIGSRFRVRRTELTKNLGIFNPKNFTKLSEMWFFSRIRIFVHPGSGIQKALDSESGSATLVLRMPYGMKKIGTETSGTPIVVSQVDQTFVLYGSFLK